MDRLQQLHEMLKASPGDSFLRFGIAKEYESRDQIQRALEYYLEIRRDDPSYVGVYYHLGMAYEKLEKFDQALEAYSAGIHIASKQHDQHAKSELMTARTNLELELD